MNRVCTRCMGYHGILLSRCCHYCYYLLLTREVHNRRMRKTSWINVRDFVPPPNNVFRARFRVRIQGDSSNVLRSFSRSIFAIRNKMCFLMIHNPQELTVFVKIWIFFYDFSTSVIFLPSSFILFFFIERHTLVFFFTASKSSMIGKISRKFSIYEVSKICYRIQSLEVYDRSKFMSKLYFFPPVPRYRF